MLAQPIYALLVVMGLGALSLIMGFILVARGIGTAEGESSIRLVGVEIRMSKVGPGVIFAIFGLALIAFAAWRLPGASSGQLGKSAADGQANAESGKTPSAEGNSTTASSGTDDIGLVRRALIASAAGRCPESVMGPLLRTACEQQMPGMGENLAARGEIMAVRYEGQQETPTGPLSIYTVNYADSQMTWMVSKSRDGKLATFFSPYR